MKIRHCFRLVVFLFIVISLMLVISQPKPALASQILDGQDAIKWLVKNGYIDTKTHVPLNNFHVFRSLVLGAGGSGPGGLKAVSAEGWSLRGPLNQPLRNIVIVVEGSGPVFDLSGFWNSDYRPNGAMARYKITQSPGSNSFDWTISHPDIPYESITDAITNGEQISCKYNRPKGPHANGAGWTPVSGRITKTIGNRAVEITWSNGAKWRRQLIIGIPIRYDQNCRSFYPRGASGLSVRRAEE